MGTMKLRWKLQSSTPRAVLQFWQQNLRISECAGLDYSQDGEWVDVPTELVDASSGPQTQQDMGSSGSRLTQSGARLKTENQIERFARAYGLVFSGSGDWHNFAVAVAEAEREACAQACEDYAQRHAKDDDDSKARAWMMLQCAADIRKRSNVRIEPQPR